MKLEAMCISKLYHLYLATTTLKVRQRFVIVPCEIQSVFFSMYVPERPSFTQCAFLFLGGGWGSDVWMYFYQFKQLSEITSKWIFCLKKEIGSLQAWGTNHSHMCTHCRCVHCNMSSSWTNLLIFKVIVEVIKYAKTLK